MKKIYLICQKGIVTEKPEFMQNPEEIPIYAVTTKEQTLKEFERLRKNEYQRQEEFRKKYDFPIPMIFEYDYKIINLYE